jgi:hypothetical protein
MNSPGIERVLRSREKGRPRIVGEIKSTWDIVLEKTKTLEITSKDREQIKRAGLNAKIHAILNRYMDSRGNREYLKDGLEGLREEEREVVKRELLLQFMDSIDLAKDNGKAIAGIETLKGEKAARVLRKLRLLTSKYRSSREKKAREIVEVLRQTLAAMGISGSAVEPSLEGKKEWIEAMEGLERDYGKRLGALKEELLNL